jgi:hypothetical protein
MNKSYTEEATSAYNDISFSSQVGYLNANQKPVQLCPDIAIA